MRITHPIAPIFNGHSETLLLGSFPSAASRAAGYAYAHPQNKFWRLLAFIYGETLPETREDKARFLLSHRLALWDVVAECEIEGSADASISGVIPNNLEPILAAAPIKRIFVNGRLAEALYNKLILPVTGRSAVYLPSTSPANASWPLERLSQAWEVIRQN